MPMVNFLLNLNCLKKLIQCRSRSRSYVNESFNAIVGYNANGAIIHYRPEKRSSSKSVHRVYYFSIVADSILTVLQILRGRYVSAESNHKSKAIHMPVLMGHILSCTMYFSTGVLKEFNLIFWQVFINLGLNYSHGTGHGVGFL